MGQWLQVMTIISCNVYFWVIVSVWVILMLAILFLFSSTHEHANHLVKSRYEISRKKEPVKINEELSLYVTAPTPLHVTPIWKRKVSRLTSKAQLEQENEKTEADNMFNDILFSGR